MLKRIVLLAANILESPFQRNDEVGHRYKIIELLGVGSYGFSYLVYDQVKDERIVLKALGVHQRIRSSGKKNFELEKELLRTVSHSGFPMYFEEGVYNSIPYYTMEHIEGKNFEQLIFQDGKRYSEKEAFSYAEQLLSLIEALHDNKIIHRDIRIPNVMLKGSEIKLIDLGLARKLETTTKQKKRFKDLRKAMTFQADFYGLGHFLLFLLYSDFSVPMDQKEKSWEEELDISLQAEDIIKRLLQIGPAYDSCSQIKADIKNILIN